MSAKFTRGQSVKQIVPAPIEGVVDGFKFSEADGQIRYLVKWTDEHGVEHERVFDENQIEAKPE